MAKLKADYINWVLTLNATQAQKEFHKLEKANKELQEDTNTNRKALAQLTAEGKKGTAEWKLRFSLDLLLLHYESHRYVCIVLIFKAMEWLVGLKNALEIDSAEK